MIVNHCDWFVPATWRTLMVDRSATGFGVFLLKKIA